ncbi:MAG: hypothetical protein CR984_00830 [Proteobacteria bacterium]|nr:MAG: hypothetical protein CR984_00830 [Pseudomonadota bacterium]PIE67697.1 MAG: hypothetical protein CSA23_02665 [Deltaproteobacteria bacterium]
MPVPVAGWLLGAGLAGFVLVRRRKNKIQFLFRFHWAGLNVSALFLPGKAGASQLPRCQGISR